MEIISEIKFSSNFPNLYLYYIENSDPNSLHGKHTSTLSEENFENFEEATKTFIIIFSISLLRDS